MYILPMDYLFYPGSLNIFVFAPNVHISIYSWLVCGCLQFKLTIDHLLILD